MNTITIELCAEDRARLDRIAEALLHHDCNRCVADVTKAVAHLTAPKPSDPVQKNPAEVMENTKNGAGEAREEAPSIPQPTKESPAEPTQQSEAMHKTEAPKDKPHATYADIHAQVLALIKAGKKEDAKNVIRGFGVEKVSGIPEEKYDEALAQLKALGC